MATVVMSLRHAWTSKYTLPWDYSDNNLFSHKLCVCTMFALYCMVKHAPHYFYSLLNIYRLFATPSRFLRTTITYYVCARTHVRSQTPPPPRIEQRGGVTGGVNILINARPHRFLAGIAQPLCHPVTVYIQAGSGLHWGYCASVVPLLLYPRKVRNTSKNSPVLDLYNSHP